MPIRLPQSLLDKFSALVADRLGLDFPKRQRRTLERTVDKMAKEFGFSEPLDCLNWLLDGTPSNKQIKSLAYHLTVGETYFFRDRNLFNLLENRILPDLIEKNCRSLRVWCPACSSGEEPYSVAIVLDKLSGGISSSKISILGTDINPEALAKAKRGIYGTWSFREIPDGVREKYFVKLKANSYQLIPRIREAVNFSYHNLAYDPYPSLVNNTNAMELILCRNVLIYFTPELRSRSVNNLAACLIEGGWLLTSPAEIPIIQNETLVQIVTVGPTAFQKTTRPQNNSVIYYDYFQFPEKTSEHIELLPAESNERELQAFLDYAAESVEVEGLAVSDELNNITLDYVESLYSQGRYSEVFEALDRQVQSSLDDKINFSTAVSLMARSLANLGRLSEAGYWAKKAIDADKLIPMYRYIYATILQEQGLLEEAKAEFQGAIYLDPTFIMAHFSLGALFKRLNRSEQSQRFFSNAFALLQNMPQEQVLQESDGITAGRLKEIIEAMNS
jgi:chemotaxis protein methyltransferase CheR